ncbi:hypothetical protein [Streptomyces sp. A1136]|uniref:hypothetical protein n=1 Tax=Streptomyces sp. A1136 TaxID=2563102 RepID=UPI00109E9385|nr:hypothetical protein [Streptomyces sp. A1136]THA57889.1 hypothetical protein E6R62_05205 [Streptomyces sp. A1136]
MMIGAADRARWAVARALWPALVLVIVLHVVGCAHGPLAGGSWRADTLTTSGTASAAPPQAAAPGQATARPVGCEGHHHAPRQCADVDGPARGRGGAEVGPNQPGTPAAGTQPGALPVRGPTVWQPVPVPGGGRALLQVWRI